MRSSTSLAQIAVGFGISTRTAHACTAAVIFLLADRAPGLLRALREADRDYVLLRHPGGWGLPRSLSDPYACPHDVRGDGDLARLHREEQFVTYTTYDDEEVRVEIKPSDDDFMPVSADRPIGRLEKVFRPVMQAAAAAATAARFGSESPDEVTLRFGVTLTGSGQAVVSRGTDESNFEITLHWHRTPSNPRPDLHY